MITARSQVDLVARIQKLSSLAAASVAALGFVGLLADALSVATGKSVFPIFSTSTALSFALAGISLWFLRRRPVTRQMAWVARWCPVVIAGIALLSLSTYFLGLTVGGARFLFRDGLETGHAFRMSPLGAGDFLLVALALGLSNLQFPRRYVYAQGCATLAALVSLLLLMEHAFGVILYGAAAHYTAISFPTMLGLFVVALGILFVQPDQALMAVSTDTGSGGKLLRRGLLITIGVPFILCWLGMEGLRARYYGTEFGLAFVATSTVWFFGTLIWGHATSLVATDRERKRAEDLLSGQKHIFEMISRGVPLEETLSTLIGLMEAQGDGFVCSILLLDRDRVHLRHGAAPGLPAEYVRAIDGRAIGPAAGSCGTAAFRREPVLVQDIATDPLWSDYRHLALPHGLRSCWSTPILDENQFVVGTYAIYHKKPFQVTPQFRNLVDLATYTAAVCIKNHTAQQLLRENILHFATVYNSVADVIFQIRVESDGQFRFDSVNPAFYKATGLKEEQVVGKLVREVVPEPSLSLVLEKYEEAIRTRQTVRWEEETRYPSETKSGDATVTPVFDSEGRCTYLIGSVHDLSERKRLEHQFRQAQKMEVVGQLAGGVAHDFNNLLTVINGYSELMLEQPALGDANRGYLAEIKKAGHHAASLTRQLLAFSRRQVLTPQRLDLNYIISDMAKMLGRLIGDDIELITVPGTDLGAVEADPGQVEQIILNLAVNARDAMPRGGTLTIETANVNLAESYTANHVGAKPGPHVMLAVTDTGIGMNAEVQKHVFEPFFTTKELGKGTGLGLSTVYGIVKQSGGNIWVYSEPGLGTTFKIYLPWADMGVEFTGHAESEAKFPGGTETILLVEDEPSVRLLVRTTLESNGYQVLEATNSAEALLIEEQHQGPIHFLLTDLVMPGISGRLLAEQIAPRRPQLKVLFISGYTNDAVVRHGGLKGDMAFLQKPFSPDDLARRVREVMDSGQVTAK